MGQLVPVLAPLAAQRDCRGARSCRVAAERNRALSAERTSVNETVVGKRSLVQRVVALSFADFLRDSGTQVPRGTRVDDVESDLRRLPIAAAAPIRIAPRG
jgi:hypothetical protein